MSYQELFAKLKETLKNAVTDENVGLLTDIDKQVDGLNSEHDALVKKHGDLQTAYIDVVKNTSFQTPGDDPTPTPKSFDEILNDELSNILKERKKENA